MALVEADRAVVIEKHQLHISDTASADVQVALLPQRINSVAEPLSRPQRPNHPRPRPRHSAGRRPRFTQERNPVHRL